MAITVHSIETSVTYTSGASWHIDDADRLHVRDSDKDHIAVYARGSWSFAETLADDADD